VKTKKINQRFKYFSIILNVRKGENVDWSPMLNNEIAHHLTELNFITPMELAKFFKNFQGIAQNSSVDKSRIRKFKFNRFIGQLEKGLNNGRPHYNLSVITSCKVLPSTVIRELSLALYGVKNCNSISIEPTHDVNVLEKYCLKLETRLLLAGTAYYPPSVDVRISEFIEALEEDDELKKFMTILACINK